MNLSSIHQLTSISIAISEPVVSGRGVTEMWARCRQRIDVMAVYHISWLTYLVDGDSLFISELIDLIGWMVAAICHQEATLKRHAISKAGYLVHMIFPVCSFFLCEKVSLVNTL